MDDQQPKITAVWLDDDGTINGRAETGQTYMLKSRPTWREVPLPPQDPNDKLPQESELQKNSNQYEIL